jgi:hypothetical protein
MHYAHQMSEHSDHAVLIASIAALATLAVAIISALAAHLASKRERRRKLYSEAVKAVLAWNEMLYRLRRREAGQERELINHFHDLQDRLAYYQAWIGSESEYMKRSYDSFVMGVKGKTEPLITTAWSEPIRPAPGNAREDDEHPEVSDLTDTFLADVRDHLSPWPWRKVAVRSRNKPARPNENGEPPTAVR